MPRVSVIIPTYNRADMVGDAIQSVLAQRFEDWEVVVIDDGSTDNTRQVIERYADPRIRYIYQANRGLPGARNTGLRNARGAYIAFLDSDDLFLPTKLSAQTAFLDEHQELGLLAGGYFEVDKELRILRELQPWQTQATLDFADWVMGCPFCPSAPLVRHEWLERAGFFDERMRRIEDWDLWLRMSHLGCQMAWLRQPVCYYRIHGGNMVRDVILMRDGMVTMLDKLYAQANLPANIMALRNRAYAHVYMNAAARAYAVGANPEGKAALTQAMGLDPSYAAGVPPRALSSLMSFALSPLCGDPDAFIDHLCQDLPATPGSPHWSRRQVYGTLNAVRAFELHQRHDDRQAARHAVSALLHDPGWFRNRGLLAIIRRGFLQLPAQLQYTKWL